MKKAFSSLLMLIAVVAFAVACKKNDDGGGGTMAATPTPTPALNCATSTDPACHPAQPNYYQQNAPQFLNYQWGYANGYCGCPVGYRPVMNYNWGMNCAPNNWFPNNVYYGGYVAYDVQTFYYGPQNGQWTSIPQVTYSPATSGSATSCGAQATAVCDIRNPATCAAGTVCRPAGGGSYLGLCSSGTGNESYQYPAPNGGCSVYYPGYGYVNVCSGSTYNGVGTSNLLPR